jgi:MFS family permease
VLVCILGLPGATSFGVAAILSGFMYIFFRTAETTFLCFLPDITPAEQRSTATGTMNLVGGAGLIACFILSALIWDEHSRLVFIIVALACFGFMLGATMLIREPERLHESTPRTKGPRAYLRSLAEQANLLKFFAAQFFWWLSFWMVSTFAVLFAVQELSLPEGQSFLLPLVFALSAALAMLPLGMLGDRFGRKGILSCMLAVWVGLLILVGFSQNLTHALISFGLCAIPYAAVVTVGYAFFLDLIPKDRTAEFVGISMLSMSSGQICGPLIGGKLIDTLGYRSMFPSAAFFLLIGLIILQFVRYREDT